MVNALLTRPPGLAGRGQHDKAPSSQQALSAAVFRHPGEATAAQEFLRGKRENRFTLRDISPGVIHEDHH